MNTMPSNPHSALKPIQPLLSASQAARLLGMSVSSVHRLSKSGKLPFLVFGKSRRYSVAALIQNGAYDAAFAADQEGEL